MEMSRVNVVFIILIDILFLVSAILYSQSEKRLKLLSNTVDLMYDTVMLAVDNNIQNNIIIDRLSAVAFSTAAEDAKNSCDKLNGTMILNAGFIKCFDAVDYKAWGPYTAKKLFWLQREQTFFDENNTLKTKLLSYHGNETIEIECGMGLPEAYGDSLEKLQYIDCKELGRV